MSKTTKFHILWQVVRTDAKQIKDPDLKLDYVLSFLNDNPNIHNFKRVLNWVQMTAVGYKNLSPKTAEAYDRCAKELVSNKERYASEVDMPNDLTKVSREDLLNVYKDLKARKYGFQYKTVPLAHTEFLQQLEQVLGIQ
jgi:hypothetical protein